MSHWTSSSWGYWWRLSASSDSSPCWDLGCCWRMTRPGSWHYWEFRSWSCSSWCHRRVVCGVGERRTGRYPCFRCCWLNAMGFQERSNFCSRQIPFPERVQQEDDRNPRWLIWRRSDLICIHVPQDLGLSFGAGKICSGWSQCSELCRLWMSLIYNCGDNLINFPAIFSSVPEPQTSLHPFQLLGLKFSEFLSYEAHSHYQVGIRVSCHYLASFRSTPQIIKPRIIPSDSVYCVMTEVQRWLADN